jgi:hypothetical protein
MRFWSYFLNTLFLLRSVFISCSLVASVFLRLDKISIFPAWKFFAQLFDTLYNLEKLLFDWPQAKDKKVENDSKSRKSRVAPAKKKSSSLFLNPTAHVAFALLRNSDVIIALIMIFLN